MRALPFEYEACGLQGMKVKAQVKLILITLLLVFVPATALAGVGSPAPEFTLPDATGRDVSLNEFRGRVVFIDFWASWCAPCKKELPELNSFIKGYDGEDIVVLAINIDKKRSHAEGFLKGINGMPEKLKVLFDPRARVISVYGALAMPTSFIVDQSGLIRYVHFGFNEDDPKKWAVEVNGLLGEARREKKPDLKQK